MSYHPLDRVSNSYENIGCLQQTKGESHFHIVFVIPCHSQELLNSGMDGHIAVSTCLIKLGHENSTAPSHNTHYKCINSKIMNCKWGFGNAIIDTGPLEMTNPGLNGIYQASGFWE